MKRVAVIGAGVSGISIALHLAKMNYQIELFDKYNPLKFNTSSGLSFNYTINLRGKNALAKFGVWEEVSSHSAPLSGRVIHCRFSEIKQSYNPDASVVLYSIPRNKLIKILADKILNFENIKMQFNKEVTSLSFNSEGCYVNYNDYKNCNENIYKADFTIVADGVNSRIRKIFADSKDSNVVTFPWSYTELQLNPDEVKKFGLSLENIHIWPSKTSLHVGIPNLGKTISLLYCASNKDKKFFLRAKKYTEALFGKTKMLKTLDSEKLGKLTSIKLNKWFVEDKIVFLGDSAHGIFPFYGQGMNAALEDSSCLSEMLQKFPNLREHAFRAYYNIRKPQTDILFELSNRHFFILKDKGKALLYNTQHHLDIFLHKLFPKLWFHEYTMMSNSLVDIVKIYRRLKIQKLFMLLPVYWVVFIITLFFEIFKRAKK